VRQEELVRVHKELAERARAALAAEAEERRLAVAKPVAAAATATGGASRLYVWILTLVLLLQSLFVVLLVKYVAARPLTHCSSPRNCPPWSQAGARVPCAAGLADGAERAGVAPR
jgi:hypothetical protein